MRELRPLNLPTLVARRNGASSSTDDLAKPILCPSTTGDSTSSASDASTPITPTFSLRGHSRFGSGSSSLTSSSTSPVFELAENSSSTSKLPMPKLPEEPSESDDESLKQTYSYEDSFDLYNFDADYSDRTTILLRDNHLYDYEAGMFGDNFDATPGRRLRRQTSSDTGLRNLSMRLSSMTTRWRSRKNSAIPAGLGIQTTNLSRPASSRSSSLTSGYFPGFDQNEVVSPTPAISIKANNSTPVSPIDEYESVHIDDPIDRRALASTPLLPPMMNAPVEKFVEPVQSPLQSPSIADPNKTFSFVGSPAQTPQISGISSPPLSSKPSIASFQRGRTSTLASIADVPPLHIEEKIDEWTYKLGHENFTIEPEPYLPDIYDAESCRVLIANWECARQQYFRHRARIVEFYGVNSKTYKFTEEKWLSVDAQWRRNNELVSAEAAVKSTDDTPVSPAEPAPLTSMPTLNDPRCESKFPQLGDLDIVGPMERIEPLPQTMPPSPTAKITTFFRSMFASRSRSATR